MATKSIHSRTRPRPRISGGVLRVLVPVTILLGWGCASAPPAPVPPVDVGQVEAEARSVSALDRPYRIVFDWEFQEPGVRVRGTGVARVEPPFRARLDLFSTGGDRLGAAALVDDDLRIPPGMAVVIPPSSMLWGALGVFRPGPGLYGAQATRPGADRSTLRYLSSEGGTLNVEMRGGFVERMVRQGEGGQAREELRVRRADGETSFPRQATWRDLVAVRELTLTLTAVEPVESYPSHVWTPDA